MNEKEISKEIIELVIARLEVIPDDALMSIGSYGQFDKNQLKDEVKNNTEVGKALVEMQLEYLRLLKEGIFYANTSNNTT